MMWIGMAVSAMVGGLVGMGLMALLIAAAKDTHPYDE